VAVILPLDDRRTTRSKLAGRNSSTEGGPFLWVRHARTTETRGDRRGARQPAGRPSTMVTCPLDPSGDPSPVGPTRPGQAGASRSRTRSGGGRHDLRLAFHCGPEVEAELGRGARGPALGRAGRRPASGRIELPPQAAVEPATAVKPDPILGWYAPGLGTGESRHLRLVGRRTAPAPGTSQDQALPFTGEAGWRRYRDASRARQYHETHPRRTGAYPRDSGGAPHE